MIPIGAAAPAKAAPAASRRVAGGEVRFDPRLLRASEFPSVARRFRSLDVDGQWQELTVPVSALVFTWCQVPVVYRLRSASRPTLSITWQDGSMQALPHRKRRLELEGAARCPERR